MDTSERYVSYSSTWASIVFLRAAIVVVARWVRRRRREFVPKLARRRVQQRPARGETEFRVLFVRRPVEAFEKLSPQARVRRRDAEREARREEPRARADRRADASASRGRASVRRHPLADVIPVHPTPG